MSVVYGGVEVGGGETDIQPEKSLAICNKVYKPFSMKQSKT